MSSTDKPPAPPTLGQSLVAGVVAGSVTALCMSPLDVARLRLQLQASILPPHLRVTGAAGAFRAIYAQDGPLGFFRGYSVSAVAVPLFWSCYFSLYQETKGLLGDAVERLGCGGGGGGGPPTESQRAALHAVSAMSTAIVCDCISNPLWVVRTRLQSDGLHALVGDGLAARSPTRGLVHGLTSIARAEGVGALYKGLVASWLGASHVAIQFPLYEALRERWAPAPDPRRPAAAGARAAAAVAAAAAARAPIDVDVELDADGAAALIHLVAAGDAGEAAWLPVLGLGSGGGGAGGSAPELLGAPPPGVLAAAAVSKLAASAVTYPHEVVRARLQDARAFPSGAQRPTAGVLDAARTIVRLEGWRGLWSGFSVNLLRALPATCIMFATFEFTLSRAQAAGLLAAAAPE